MELSQARAKVGCKVVYRGHSFGNQSGQEGVITSVNDTYVFVRYGADYGSKATRPEDLALLF